MRYFVLLVLLSACSQAPQPQTLSAGCRNINDAFYDGAYQSGNVFFSSFKAGESVSVALSVRDSTTKLWLVVTDATLTPKQDIAARTAASYETLSYRFERDMPEAEVYWSADVGVPSWSVTCGP